MSDLEHNLNIARELATAGVPIFLAHPALDTAGEWIPGGGHQGSGYWFPPGWHTTVADPAVLDAYRPGMAVCAVMGHIVDGLDIDPRNGGEASRAGLMNADMWPRSYGTASTPSGGTHELVATLGVASLDGTAPGLDVKAGKPDGSGRGFLFVAPTLKLSKTTGEIRPYAWTTDPLLDTDGDVSGQLLAAHIEQLHAGGRDDKPWAEPEPYDGPPFAELPDAAQRRIQAWTAKAVDAITEELRASASWPADYRDADSRGWERLQADAAFRLGRLARASWCPLDLPAARAAFLENAPTNSTWTAQDVDAKWSSQHRRKAPAPLPETLQARDAPTLSVVGGTPGHVDPAPKPETEARGVSALDFFTIAELRARVASRGPRRWLLRGIWPAGDYGIHAAEQKAQKTWTTADLAVAVSSGTPWLGLVPVDHPGPVLMFVGEGGDGNTLRRLDAAAEARGVHLDDLPIVVCTRAPHLNNVLHLKLFAEQVERQRPALVTLDPLYLAARGAELGDLYKMGALLEQPQRICQSAGAALWVVTHFNRQQGNGARRITGAGPAEWGRVLISGAVKSRHTDMETMATSVVTELDIIGGEVPDQTLRVNRRIWADDHDNLDSALHMQTSAAYAAEEETTVAVPSTLDLAPAERKLLEALEHAEGPRTSSELVDEVVRRHGHPLKRETCSRALNKLAGLGLVDSAEQGQFKQKLWMIASADLSRDQRDVTRDDHADSSRVISVTAPIGGHASRITPSHTPDQFEDDHTTSEQVGLLHLAGRCSDCGFDHTTQTPLASAWHADREQRPA